MEQQEERFQVTVQINKGLEPTTFTVIAEESSEITIAHEMVFKLSREKDKDTLAIIALDTDHCWQQIEGDFKKDEIDAIGAAIDTYYA
jgi:formyltetrahydrofolate hydrolase